MADPNRMLDALTRDARRDRRAGEPDADSVPSDDPRVLALHEALREPVTASPTPNLVPIVMERIGRRTTAARAASADAPPRARFGGVLAWLRDGLAHIALGPVAAVGSLAAVLAVALWSAGAEGSAGALSGAAAGVAAPSLLVVAVVALGVALAAAWLRRR